MYTSCMQRKKIKKFTLVPPNLDAEAREGRKMQMDLAVSVVLCSYTKLDS